jgi:type VI secretion system protein ImpL
MKQTLLKILKVLFIVAVVALVILGTFGGVMVLDWPWWVGLFILLGFVGLGIAFLFFKNLWSKRREQDFVDQIIEQDEAQLKHLAEKDRVDAKEMQERWKEAIDALRRSHLRKRGNPLYVLP